MQTYDSDSVLSSRAADDVEQLSSAAGGALRLSTVFGMDDTMSATESVMDPHLHGANPTAKSVDGFSLTLPSPPLRDRTSCHVPLQSLAYTTFMC